MVSSREIVRVLAAGQMGLYTFTGTPGVYVRVADTVRGFQEILEGKHDDLPEEAFRLVGTIDDAVSGSTSTTATSPVTARPG